MSVSKKNQFNESGMSQVLRAGCETGENSITFPASRDGALDVSLLKLTGYTAAPTVAPEGSGQLAYDEAGKAVYVHEGSGVWTALGGGGGGGDDLETVLQVGNITGAKDIVVSNPQSIRFEDPGIGPSIAIVSDGDTPTVIGTAGCVNIGTSNLLQVGNENNVAIGVNNDVSNGGALAASNVLIGVSNQLSAGSGTTGAVGIGVGQDIDDDGIGIGNNTGSCTVGTRAVRIGRNGDASDQYCISIGDNASSTGSNGTIAIGKNTKASVSGAIALGADAWAQASGAISIGRNVVNTLGNSVKFPVTLVTVGSGTDVVFSAAGGGLLQPVSSTIRVKKNIAPLSDECDVEKLYELNPIMYTQKGDKSGERVMGVIAEEAHDLGLAPLIVYDHFIDPETGEQEDEKSPCSVKYRQMSVMILDLVQRQKIEIDELRNRIDDLELNVL